MSVDKVQGVNGQSLGAQWMVWTISRKTLETIQGVQPDRTMSMDKVQGVHGQSLDSGLCPWTLGTLSRNRCNSDLEKKLVVEVHTLYTYIYFLQVQMSRYLN